MTACRTCGKPYVRVDLDHEWPDCDCAVDPTCSLCDGTGKVWRIEEDPETGEWFRVLRPCSCVKPPHTALWGVAAVLAVLIPMLLVLMQGMEP